MTTERPLQDYTDVELVGYDYFAEQLSVGLRTIYAYASEKNAQRLEDFPRPVTPPKHRQPLFRRDQADEFIARRKAGSPTRKGRVKPTELTPEQQSATWDAGSILGHEINLEDRTQLREAIYGELKLPVLTTTKERGEPAITHAALKKLYKKTGHPFLFQVLTYRGITVNHVDPVTK